MIIDTLTSKAGDGGLFADERQKFTVNNAVNEVTANAPAGLAQYPIMRTGEAGLADPRGCAFFAPRDNVYLLSVGITMPFSFGVGSRPFTIAFMWYEETTQIRYGVVECRGSVNVPFTDGEVTVGTYCKWPVQGPDYQLFDNSRKKALCAVVLHANPATDPHVGYVSMLNVPAALNGLDLPICPFVKVQHSIPLS